MMIPLVFLHIGFVDILDIAVIAAILYFLFRWLRGSSARNIFIAILLLLVIRVVAVALNMKMLSALLGTLIDVGAIALVIIFQPEIRHFLTRLGRDASIKGGNSRLLGKLFRREAEGLDSTVLGELRDACGEMAEQKTGALIVLQRRDSLQDIVETGDMIDAEISKRLIENIFFKNSPLHDGAMVISGGRIVAARCTLPISDNPDIPARYGMRHKAAIGLSSLYDADVIVVSEQTGRISFVRDGVITTLTTKSEIIRYIEEGRKS